MTHNLEDARKKFILTTAGNFYGTVPPSSLADRSELNNFLDDGNEFILSFSRHDGDLQLSNKVESWGNRKEKVLVFFKLYPTVITNENLHQSLLVSSMLESPINTLYQAVKQVFAPVLLQDEHWRSAFDPKLANLLTELEVGLGSVVRHSGAKSSSKKGFVEDDVLGILTPNDEFQFWVDLSECAERSSRRERASFFTEQFKPLQKEFAGLDGLSMSDVVDLVEQSKDTLDDVWRQTDFEPYPETRMVRLMDVIGGALGRYVQKKLSGLQIFVEPFGLVRENLRTGISICEQWVDACKLLTGQLWKRNVPHAWKGSEHCPEILHSLTKRLNEVVTLRTVHEKLLSLRPGGKQQALTSERVFEPFSGLNPVHYNPYTEYASCAAPLRLGLIQTTPLRELVSKKENEVA